jgi:hypothetical protein
MPNGAHEHGRDTSRCLALMTLRSVLAIAARLLYVLSHSVKGEAVTAQGILVGS